MCYPSQPGILHRWSLGMEKLLARHSNCSVITTFKNLLKTHLFIQSYYST